ncbi:MAG TPA: trypsin-like peptidase domain-containing protein [Rugosimonospora sp.]|nr:trypsin-like peptidase domain-containing protein [Rugosimonospora sp.]
MPSRFGPAFRRARNSWAAVVVVLAGVISALAAVADLTHWVSIAAAVAAVIGGARVLIGELVVPLRMDAVDEATAVIANHPHAIDDHPQLASWARDNEVGTAFHVGGGRWITSANLAKARVTDRLETLPPIALNAAPGAVWLGLGKTVVAGQVIHLMPDVGLAVVQATQTVERWPRRVRLAKEQPVSGDRVRIVGWSLPRGNGEARRLSVELFVQGVLRSGAVLLTGPRLPLGFVGAPAVDSRTGRVVGFVGRVVSGSAGESEALNEAHVVLASALLTEEGPRA